MNRESCKATLVEPMNKTMELKMSFSLNQQTDPKLLSTLCERRGFPPIHPSVGELIERTTKWEVS